MPDLIIKPAAQSGNKVIIQDQAGGAVITTADSGATIANATLVAPALGTPASGVVTNLSGVLPAGVTGGSGLTALGTVATGNLSNTAIVYPDGHIIKIKSKTYTSTHQVGVSGSWTTVGLATTNNLDITMDTPASSSSKYFIQVNLLVSDSPNNTLDFRLIDGSSNHIIRADTAGSRNRSFIGLGHQSTGNGSFYHLRNGVASYLWSPGSALPQQIILQGTNHSGSEAFYINRSYTDTDADWISRSVSTMTVMEIAG